MTHGSLFSGIGGFDLAAEWMGWENKFHCEWNPFCQKILSHHFPNAKQHGDITKTDFTIYRGQCDILTGGFPCQPYSTAGKRLGTEDDRHLWPEMLRAISEIQPSWVVGENVRGLTNWNGGLVFDEVQADLEAKGYEVLPFLLPACAVNAPHRRDRIWFIAYNANTRNESLREKTVSEHGSFVAANSEGKQNIGGGSGGFFSEPTGLNVEGATANSGSAGQQKCNPAGISNYTGHHARGSWGNFPTQSPVCNGNDGVPAGLDGITFSKWRNESIKAGGNAIVPQVALQIFKSIESFNSINNHK